MKQVFHNMVWIAPTVELPSCIDHETFHGPGKQKGPDRQIRPFSGECTCDYRLLLMVEKTWPTNGPMMVTAAMTTTATSTRINAYSTMPCPFSLRASFM